MWGELEGNRTRQEDKGRIREDSDTYPFSKLFRANLWRLGLKMTTLNHWVDFFSLAARAARLWGLSTAREILTGLVLFPSSPPSLPSASLSPVGGAVPVMEPTLPTRVTWFTYPGVN